MEHFGIALLFLLLLLLAVVIIVDVYVLFHVSVTNRFWASKYAGQRCKMIGVFLEHTKQKLLIEFKRPALKSVFIIFEAFKSNVLKNESQKKNRIIGLFLGCREKERAHTKSWTIAKRSKKREHERTNKDASNIQWNLEVPYCATSCWKSPYPLLHSISWHYPRINTDDGISPVELST